MSLFNFIFLPIWSLSVVERRRPELQNSKICCTPLLLHLPEKARLNSFLVLQPLSEQAVSSELHSCTFLSLQNNRVIGQFISNLQRKAIDPSLRPLAKEGRKKGKKIKMMQKKNTRLARQEKKKEEMSLGRDPCRNV